MDMDETSRWRVALARPCTIALAVIMPSLVLVGSIHFAADDVSGPLGPTHVPAMSIPNVVAEMPVIALTRTPLPAMPPAVGPLQPVASRKPSTTAGPTARSRTSRRKSARVVSEDIAVLSVLVEHIDAERRKAERRPPKN
ncbi:hypothetical protein SAMN05660880_03021 [Luteibacter sp. 22Crub2.1]|nr:hypothetical protein SAMN05660880_03021 [Luteibacter sp. 22Crub2.1]